MAVPRFLRRFLARFDVVLTRYSRTTPHIRLKLLNAGSLEVAIDVGANVGQYAEQLRESGYRGRIISFEPLQEAFRRLAEVADRDPLWECFNMAVGDFEGVVPMHVSGNLQSSSFLPMRERLVHAAPETAYQTVEKVKMTTLDAFADAQDWSRGRLFLKLDVQGYESKVLAGAKDLLSRVALIELELSLIELYEGQELLPEMMKRVESMGFRPVWLEQGYADPRSGYLLQVNGLFIREDS